MAQRYRKRTWLCGISLCYWALKTYGSLLSARRFSCRSRPICLGSQLIWENRNPNLLMATLADRTMLALASGSPVVPPPQPPCECRSLQPSPTLLPGTSGTNSAAVCSLQESWGNAWAGTSVVQECTVSEHTSLLLLFPFHSRKEMKVSSPLQKWSPLTEL